MLASTIEHGGVKYDLCSDGSVVLCRPSSGETWRLSPSELRYLIAILQIHGWPVAPLPSLQPAEPQSPYTNE